MKVENEIPWWSVVSTGLEVEGLAKVINSGYYNEGQVTFDFEVNLSKNFDNAAVITSTSGTSALFLALRAVGVGVGDLVAIPNLTFIATATAVTLTGAKVVLMDVDPIRMTSSEGEIQRVEKLGIKAIIPVHVSGRSAWNAELRRIRDEGRIYIIEDAAEAMGCRDPETGKYLGTIGNAGIFSFSPNKIITTGQGGAVITNDEGIEVAVRRLKDQGRPVRGTGGADLHDFEGYNFKFTNIQSAVGIAQLSSLDSRRIFLSNLFTSYRASIVDCVHQRLLPFDVQKGEFPLWPEMSFKNKAAVKRKFLDLKIGFRDIWLPISTQKPYFSKDPFMNSKQMSNTTLWLPSSFNLTGEEINLITQTLICEECK
ncbi:WecE Predicted pyridoxal phosphate-dependent enzyme apparently involved in regulation of cell wall biogenesis [Candidatus Nanopelagicaceae bacterium]